MESTTQPLPAIRTIVLDRNQTYWAPVDLDRLIEEDHPARMIWALSGQFDLSRFEAAMKARQGAAGRPCWPPRLLVSIWVYSYTLGAASARAIERMLSQEPGLRWLAAGQEINYHTLSDFRVDHKAALEDIFTQFLALLETAKLVDLHTLLHDGTKIRAVAGRASFHRRKTLEKRMRQARKVVRKMAERAEQEGEGQDQKRKAAQKRAAAEALKRAEQALEKLKKLEAKTRPAERDQLRVSESEPEAGKMKQQDGGFAPSYNMQVTTEAQSRIIVGIGLSEAKNDQHELLPALETAKQNCGALPEKIIADSGYATRSNVEQTSELGVELIAPWKPEESREAGACKRNGIQPEFGPSAFRAQGSSKLICPAGRTLILIQQKMHHRTPRNVFEARAADCNRCRHRVACRGNRVGPRRVERTVESAAMKRYLARMERREVKTLYKKRSEIAEFPHLWVKAVKKWQRFSVRGIVKAKMEALWVALAYNVAQWIRLRLALAPAG